MTSALVETLTAEVRTLVVGKRQVTLSVYRQLDSVPVDEIEPFGRVNDTKDTGNYVIGRHSRTGALARARYMTSFPRPLITREDLDGGVVRVCSVKNLRGGVTVMYEMGDRSVSLDIEHDAIEGCGIKSHNVISGERCGGWSTNGHDDLIRSTIAIEDEAKKPHLSAANLPLIVLAGLK